jgi:hypothetical protein
MSLIRAIGRWFRKLTTSRDNQTPDVIRLGAILIGAQFLANAGFDLFILNNAFDPSNYGTGAAAILAATGAALWAKRKDEPGADT